MASAGYEDVASQPHNDWENHLLCLVLMTTPLSNPPTQSVVIWQKLSFACAMLALSIGVIALCGWILGIEALKRVHHSLVTMKANTSICLILGSLSLLLQQREDISRLRRSFAQGFALVIAMVGATTFGEAIARAPVRGRA